MYPRTFDMQEALREDEDPMDVCWQVGMKCRSGNIGSLCPTAQQTYSFIEDPSISTHEVDLPHYSNTSPGRGVRTEPHSYHWTVLLLWASKLGSLARLRIRRVPETCFQHG